MPVTWNLPESQIEDKTGIGKMTTNFEYTSYIEGYNIRTKMQMETYVKLDYARVESESDYYNIYSYPAGTGGYDYDLNLLEGEIVKLQEYLGTGKISFYYQTKVEVDVQGVDNISDLNENGHLSVYNYSSKDKDGDGQNETLTTSIKYYTTDETTGRSVSKELNLETSAMKLEKINVTRLYNMDEVKFYEKGAVPGVDEPFFTATSGNKTYTVPAGKTINEYFAITGNVMSDTGSYSTNSSGVMYNGYDNVATWETTYSIEESKLQELLTEQEIKSLTAITRMQQGDYILAGTLLDATCQEKATDYVSYYEEQEEFPYSFLKLDLGYDYDVDINNVNSWERKNITLSMEDYEIWSEKKHVINENPVIYLNLSSSKDFQYKINKVSMTTNSDIQIINTELIEKNNETFLAIYCNGTYDSEKINNVQINVDLYRKLINADIGSTGTVIAYMITDNENYTKSVSNEHELDKDGTIPNRVYRNVQEYSVESISEIYVQAGIEKGNARRKTIYFPQSQEDGSITRGGYDDPVLANSGDKVNFRTELSNSSTNSINNIELITLLPVLGNVEGTTISLQNLSEITVEKENNSTGNITTIDSSNYDMYYTTETNPGESAVWSLYEQGTTDVSTVTAIKLDFKDTYTLLTNNKIAMKYKMTMPTEEGMAGAATIASYNKNSEIVKLTSTPVFAKTGNPNGTVKITKTFEGYESGNAPEGISLEGIEFKLVDINTAEVLVTDGTTAEGIFTTDSTGVATLENVPEGEYRIEEVSTFDNYSGIGNLNYVYIINGNLEEITVENKLKTSTVTINKTWEDTNDQQGTVTFSLVRTTEDSLNYAVTQTTDENGTARFLGVPYGEYTITETRGVYGWYADEQTNIEINEEIETIDVENKIAKGNLEIIKTVPEGDSVEGLTFEITGIGYISYTNKEGTEVDTNSYTKIKIGEDYSATENVNVEISENKSTATITLSNLYLGLYTVEEVEIPNIEGKEIEKYVAASKTTTIDSKDETAQVTITNNWKYGKLEIKKTANLGELEIGDLSGFSVRITGTSYYGTDVDITLGLDENGYASKTLEIGEYKVEEVAVDGYTTYYKSGAIETIEPPTVEILYGATTTQEIRNEHTGLGFVRIEKSLEGISDPNKVIERGIQFKIQGQNVAGGRVEEIINIDKIDSDKNVAYGVSNAISTGGEYELVEVEETIPEYFEGVDAQAIQITTQNTEENPLIIDVENKRGKGNLEVKTTTDPVGGPLTNITYTVQEIEINSDGTYTKIGEVTKLEGSNLEGKESEAELLNINAGNYLVTLDQIPTGWEKDVAQIVEVPNNSTGIVIFELTQKEQLENTTISITKQVLNSNNEEITESDYVSAGLDAQESFEIKLRNTESLETYFVFVKNGETKKIHGIPAGTYEIEEVYKPKYQFEAVYEASQMEKIEPQDGKYLVTLGTEEELTNNVQLKIVNKINTDFGFGGQHSIENLSKQEAEQIEKVTVTKSIIYIEDEDGNALPGAQFKILNSKGKEVYIGTEGNTYTTASNKLIIKGLPVGEYKFVNVSVPSGYLKPEEKTINVYEDAARVVRIEIQKNIPRGSLILSTTKASSTEEASTYSLTSRASTNTGVQYVSKSKYKVVDTVTGELVKFQKTATGDYRKTNLPDGLEEITLKSGPVEVTGIEVGTYEIGLVDVTDGYEIVKDEVETVTVVEGQAQNVNVEVNKAEIVKIDADYDCLMYLDSNGDLWKIWNSYPSNQKNAPELIEIDAEIVDFAIVYDYYNWIAIDKQGKVWLFGGYNTDEGTYTYSVPTCISDIEENPLYKEKQKDPNFKIVKVIMGDYDSSNYPIILDNYGRVWKFLNSNETQDHNTVEFPYCISEIEKTKYDKETGLYQEKLKNPDFKIVDGFACQSNIWLIDNEGRVWGEVDGRYACISDEITETLFEVKIVQITRGYSNVLGLDDNGNVWEWYYSYYDSIFENNGNPKCISDNADEWLYGPQYISKLNIKKAYGYGTTLIDGNGKVWVVGDNNYGQLGTGDSNTVSSLTCISNDSTNILYGKNIINIVNNGNAVYMLDDKSNIYVAGMDDLSLNSNGYIYSPIKINTMYQSDFAYNLKFVKVEAESNNCYAIDELGRLWGWGSNYGAGSTSYPEIVPIPTSSKIIDISAASGTAMALDEKGNVYSWGDNGYYQITENGSSDYYETYIPVDITHRFGTSKIVDVQVGGWDCSYAVDEEGKVWVVGVNTYGQLGTGTTTTLEKFTCINDNIGEALFGVKIVKIQTGGSGSVTVLDSEGKVWTWGNISGTGIGNAKYYTDYAPSGKYYITEPTCISDIENHPLNGKVITDISKSNDSGEATLALDQNGEVYIWGTQYNSYNTSTSVYEVSPIGSNGPLANTYLGLKYKFKYINIDGGNYWIMDEKGNLYMWANSYNSNLHTNILNQNGANVVYMPIKGYEGVQYSVTSDPGSRLYQKQFIDLSSNGNMIIAIDSQGQLWTWGSSLLGRGPNAETVLEPSCLFGGAEKNALYNEKIAEIINDTYVQTETGKIYQFSTSGTPTYYMNGELALKETLGVEIKQVYNSLKENNTKGEYMIVLDTEGRLWVWGKSYLDGQGLFNGTRDFPTSEEAHLTNIDEFNNKKAENPNFGISKFIMKDDGSAIFAIDTEGGLWVYGHNNNGEMGFVPFTSITFNGVTTYIQTQLRYISGVEGSALNVALTNGMKIEEIVKSNSFTTMLKGNDGSYWVAGFNSYGQFGNGTTSDKVTSFWCINKDYSADVQGIPTLEGTAFNVALENGMKIEEIVLFDGLNTILKGSDGTYWVAGMNGYGQLGNSTTQSVTSFWCMNKDFSDVVDGYTVPTLAGKSIDKIELIGLNKNTCMIMSEGALYVTGISNSAYTPHTTQVLVPTIANDLLGSGIKDYALTDYFGIAYGENGKIIFWGRHGYNRICTVNNFSNYFTIEGNVPTIDKIIGINYTTKTKSSKTYYVPQLAFIDTEGKVWKIDMSDYTLSTSGSTFKLKCCNDVAMSTYNKLYSAYQADKSLKMVDIISNNYVLDSNGDIWYIHTGNNCVKYTKYYQIDAQNIYGEATVENMIKVIKNKDTYGIIKDDLGRLWKYDGSFSENQANYNLVNSDKNNELYGKNIVSMTNYKALDDEGNLYVWESQTGLINSPDKPTNITEIEYNLDPVFSDGWTTVKVTY